MKAHYYREWGVSACGHARGEPSRADWNPAQENVCQLCSKWRRRDLAEGLVTDLQEAARLKADPRVRAALLLDAEEWEHLAKYAATNAQAWADIAERRRSGLTPGDPKPPAQFQSRWQTKGRAYSECAAVEMRDQDAFEASGGGD